MRLNGGAMTQRQTDQGSQTILRAGSGVYEQKVPV